MMNYIKSEMYRITHTRGIYYFTGILILLSIVFNVAVGYLGGQYAITSFSYSNLVANPMMFVVMGLVVVYFLYEGNRKNGNLKNTIASGISRNKVFLGECIVGSIVATFVMAVTLIVYISSAKLLLEKIGPVQISDLLLEIPAVYLIAIAGLISAIVCMEYFEKNVVGIIVWMAVWFIVPKILMYVGIRFEVVYNVAIWLPNNFFGFNTQHVNMHECITVWDTSGGWFKCLLSGAIGIIVFTLSGISYLKRKDL